MFTKSLFASLLIFSGSASAFPYTGTITLQMYRHGQTCANFIGDCSPNDFSCIIKLRDSINSYDSILSNNGIYQAKKFGVENPTQPDLIITSPMLSTIETALVMFNGTKDVYPMPWLMDTNKANKPETMENQKKILTYTFGASAYDRVKFGFLEKAVKNANKTMDCHEGTVTGNPRCEANFENFKLWLATTFLESSAIMNNDMIPTEVKEKISKNLPLNLLVIAHGTQGRVFANLGKQPLPSLIGYEAKYSLKCQNKCSVIRTDDGDDKAWKEIKWAKTFVDSYTDVCRYQETFAAIGRCIQRNPDEFSKITSHFMKGDCGSGSLNLTSVALETQFILVDSLANSSNNSVLLNNKNNNTAKTINNTNIPTPANESINAKSIQKSSVAKDKSSDATKTSSSYSDTFAYTVAAAYLLSFAIKLF